MKRAGSININLMTQKMRKRDTSRCRFLIAAVFGVFYGAMACWGYHVFQARLQAERYNAALLAQIGRRTDTARLAGDVQRYQSLVKKKARLIDSLATTRVLTTELLRRVELSIPEGTVLTNLEVADHRLTLEGFAPGYHQVARLAAGLTERWGYLPVALQCEKTSKNEISFKVVVELKNDKSFDLAGSTGES